MPEIRIFSINFEDDGIALQYTTVPDDVRLEGKLAHTHQLMVSASHPDYREDMEALHRKAQRLLANALEDFSNSEPYIPDDDEDDERGMGDH